jgi:PAS domain S-box-containing protein
MGYSVRVSADDVAAFETRARAEGDAGYRVFDRDEGRARAEDGEVVALRHIEPRAGNSAALGVNALSVPAARAAIVTTRRSGQPVATAGFRLTQAIGDQTGVVIYQALYGREGGREVGSEAERQAQFRGVVFVTVDTGRIMAGLASSDPDYLQWCLVDPTPATARARLAGPAGCETAIARARTLQSRRALTLAGRPVQLLISADEAAVPGPDAVARWLLATMGMAATAMLGALLLTVTGHSRRTELAVEAGTAVLRHEIAERTQVERALRDSEERLRAILDHVPLGVMFVDPQGALLECNPKLCDMLGRSASELRGRSVAEFMDGDLLAAARLQRREPQAASPPPRLEPVRLRHADGRDRLVRVVTSALRDGQGRLTRVVAVLEDVTEHLRLQASERSLQRAEAASLAKSEFLSRMSHELRTPLNAMIGFAQLLDMQSAGALDAKQRDWTQHIQHAGWHLLELINETLDLARIESGAMQLTLVPVALAPAIASCQAMVAATASEHGVSLTVAPGLHVPAVLGDATRVKQVLTNLLSNAIKYNRRGGGVTLSTRMAGDGQVEIAVADTGLGMTDEQVQELFQPYNRLGRDGSGIEGTGIGLVISRRLADLMGGSLGVSSRAGEGSTFTLRLPAAALAAAVEAPLDTAAPAPYPERLVHYVEDNETNVLVMQGVLAQRPQIELQTTTLGLDALSAVRARRPDLILLDMHLPDISGIELLRHLKGDDDLAPIPVIAVSADATPAHIERALTMGARHYVTKPFDLRAFLQIVDEVLHESDTRW